MHAHIHTTDILTQPHAHIVTTDMQHIPQTTMPNPVMREERDIMLHVD